MLGPILCLAFFCSPKGDMLRAVTKTETTRTTLEFSGRRGVGGNRTFGAPVRHPLDATRYDVDPYTPRWTAYMPQARLSELQRAGFDFLRINVDPGPLLEAENSVLDNRLREIRSAIDASLAGNLKVIIDIHVSENHPLWNFRQVTSGFDQPAFQRYLGTVRALSNLVSAYDPSSVALELFNEPPPPCHWSDRPDWPLQLEVIYGEARKVAPNHSLLLAGACWASIDGLLALDPSKFDENTIFVFHYYEPKIFTYQGFWGSWKYLQYVPRLPYPPDSTQLDGAIQRVATRIMSAPDIPTDERPRQIAEATKQLRHYFTNVKGIATIQEDFVRVREWATRHAIASNRIMLGEFGAMKDVYGKQGAAPQDRARWLKDVRVTAEGLGYSWSVWALTNTDGIVTGDLDGPLDKGVLKALGLNVP